MRPRLKPRARKRWRHNAPAKVAVQCRKRLGSILRARMLSRLPHLALGVRLDLGGPIIRREQMPIVFLPRMEPGEEVAEPRARNFAEHRWPDPQIPKQPRPGA